VRHLVDSTLALTLVEVRACRVTLAGATIVTGNGTGQRRPSERVEVRAR